MHYFPVNKTKKIKNFNPNLKEVKYQPDSDWKLVWSDELSEFHNNFFILLNLAVGGASAGRPNASTKFPQYMYIDWIRVYQKKD